MIQQPAPAQPEVEGATSGKLKVNVTEARLERDTEWLGNMDPYCVITHRMQILRTKTHTDGGKEPVWNEWHELDVKYFGDDIEIAIWDAEVMGKDKLIGNVICKASGLTANGGLDDWWQITHNGKCMGKIHLICKWEPKGGQPAAQ